MRIVNTGHSPRYLSYGDTLTGGKTLDPGASSRELPLSYVHSLSLWKDIDKGLIQIKLNDEDKEFMRRVMEIDAKPITMVPASEPVHNPTPLDEREKSQPVEVKEDKKSKPAPVKPQLQPVLDDPKPVIPDTPGQKAAKELLDTIIPDGKPKALSLQDLMHQNQSVAIPKK